MKTLCQVTEVPPEKVALPPDASLEDARRIIGSTPAGVAVLLRDQKPVGLLTERDLITLFVEGVPFHLPAEAYAQKKIVAGSEEQTLEYAVHLMVDHNIRRILVQDKEGRFCGVVSQEEVLRAMEEELFRTKLKARHLIGGQRELLTVPAHAPLSRVYSMVVEKKVSMVPVVDGGKPVGVITESDLLRLCGDPAVMMRPVSEEMAAPVVTVPVGEEIDRIVGLMEERRIHHLIVVDEEGAPAGTITNRDIVRNLEGNYRTFLESKLRHARAALDVLPQGVLEIVRLDGRYRIHWANKKAEELLGTELVNQECAALFPDGAEIDGFLERLGEPGREERLAVSFSGGRYELSGVRTEKGHQLVIHDMTPYFRAEEERRRTLEEAAAASRRLELYKAALDSAEDALLIAEADTGALVDVNKKTCNLLGYDREELLTMKVPEIRSPLAGKPSYQSWAELAELTRLHPQMIRFSNDLRKDGTTVPVETGITSVEQDGKRYLLALSRDITQRIRTEEELRKREERYRNLFEKNKAVELLIDPATSRIVDANRAAADYYGYTEEELKTLKITDINVLSKEEIFAEMEKAREERRNHFYFRHRLADGTIRDVEVHSGPFPVENGEILYSIVHDVTDRKNAEKALEELNESLGKKVEEEVEKRRENERMMIQQSRLAAMGEMIGNIAHQWRQPLNALGLTIQDIADAHSFGELDQAYLDRMVEESMAMIQRMSETIDDFRNFFRPDREKHDFSINETVRNALAIVDASLRNNDIDVRMEMEEGLTAHGFKNEYAQAVLVILGNAKDVLVHAPVPRKILIRGERVGEITRLIVEDNGGGIDQEVIDKVFDPYFTTKHPSEGTGIGLYMAKMIIERNMGGHIRAENIAAPGKGARFILET